MDWVKLVEMVAPLVLGACDNPRVKDLAPLVVKSIVLAEHAKTPNGQPLSGAAKLALAQQLTGVGVQGLNTAAGKQLVDPALVDDDFQHATSAIVDTVNLIRHAHDAQASALVKLA